MYLARTFEIVGEGRVLKYYSLHGMNSVYLISCTVCHADSLGKLALSVELLGVVGTLDVRCEQRLSKERSRLEVL